MRAAVMASRLCQRLSAKSGDNEELNQQHLEYERWAVSVLDDVIRLLSHFPFALCERLAQQLTPVRSDRIICIGRRPFDNGATQRQSDADVERFSHGSGNAGYISLQTVRRTQAQSVPA